jgi:hypothetical protein
MIIDGNSMNTAVNIHTKDFQNTIRESINSVRIRECSIELMYPIYQRENDAPTARSSSYLLMIYR